MATKPENYRDSARRDAADTVDHFFEATVAQIIENGKASNDMYNDYPHGDSYHHENHVDKGYSLKEAAEVLDQLSAYEADDSGLWEGLAPREAVSAMAAYTYGNAVYDLWRDLIEKINDEVESTDLSVGPKEWSPRVKTSKKVEDVVRRVLKNWRRE